MFTGHHTLLIYATNNGHLPKIHSALTLKKLQTIFTQNRFIVTSELVYKISYTVPARLVAAATNNIFEFLVRLLNKRVPFKYFDKKVVKIFFLRFNMINKSLLMGNIYV